MDFIPPLPCPKDAPLQLAHNLDNHLQLSLMDTHQSPEETHRCLQHKSSPPHSGRPLARLRHERINSYQHRTTTPNDNNPQTTSKCLRTHLPSATRTQAIDIMASIPPSSWRRPRGCPPLRWADQIVKDTQMSLSDAVTATQDRTSWRSHVRDATRPGTQAT